jgi:hypothetical protein
LLVVVGEGAHQILPVVVEGLEDLEQGLGFQ